MHVYSIASELHRRGRSPIIAVPQNAHTVDDVGRPPFAVVTYRDARRGKLSFPDGRGPDLVHAFTPRELVRKLTADVVAAHDCPYVVHLEDNEDALLSAQLGGVDVESLRTLPAQLLDGLVADWQCHPLRSRQFLEHAAGVTVVIERLLELVPPHLPAAVVRAGFEEAVLSPGETRDATRSRLGVEPDDFAVVYNGNVHATNLEEMRGLWSAVARLRDEGHRVVLVKTGWSAPEVAGFPALGDGLRDLGWVPRRSVPDLLAAADVLVQPGIPGPFNDYRFPSKLPEFLASGRPVVLPRANVGLELEDGRQALVLEHGDADEIASAVARLAADPELRQRLGEEGRAFALRELRWERSVDAVEELYEELATAARPAAPAWTITQDEPRVKVLAVVDRSPTATEISVARAHGIYGFCLDADALHDLPDAPFCIRFAVPAAGSRQLDADALDNPRLVHVDGRPLLLVERTVAPPSSHDGFVREFEPLQHVQDPAAYESLLQTRLGAPVLSDPAVRSLVTPPIGTSWERYELWLRKLVLQTLACAPVQEPVLLVDAVPVWTDPSRHAEWLGATHSALQEGVRLFDCSRRLDLSWAPRRRPASVT